MKTIEDCILSQVSISPQDLVKVTSNFEARSLGKNELLLESGQLCREMAFVSSGYLRIFNYADGKEITLWIGGNGSFLTSLSSFVFQTPNHWNIQAITDSEILVIQKEDFDRLLKEVPAWLEFDNILLSRAFALLEGRMFEQLHTTSKQRFEALLAENPAIFNHVPLQYIASMIGVTPETLSRLRKSMSQTSG